MDPPVDAGKTASARPTPPPDVSRTALQIRLKQADLDSSDFSGSQPNTGSFQGLFSYKEIILDFPGGEAG